MLTRRGFIGGSTVIAAGAALGISPRIRKTAPTKVSMMFFGPNPISMPVQVFSEGDRFGIRIAPDSSGTTTVLLSLRDVRDVISSGRGIVRKVRAEVWKRGEMTVNISACGDTFSMIVDEVPVWMPTKDIERVL